MDKVWWQMWEPSLMRYGVVLQLFVDERITADEFEILFLPLFKDHGTPWPPDAFRILERMFFAVDDYSGDPRLRDEHDIDEIELKRQAIIALRQLSEIALGPN